jgi:hypothetical protein
MWTFGTSELTVLAIVVLPALALVPLLLRAFRYEAA